jgi:dTDP-4-amino-4,6-dideoxygalactose transaminase
MVRIPFIDLQAAHADCGATVEEAILRVARSGRHLGGPEVEAFEHAWASEVGASECVGVASGTDALALALQAVGVGRDDEVVVPAHTCPATWMAVHLAGAVPVAAPVDPARMTLDPDGAERCIGPRTRAIVAVHLYGQPADLDPLCDIARRRGIALVEDAAQAHGARYRDRPIGAHGDAVAWSFYPTKNLGANGHAGAVTTDRHEVAERVRTLSDYGRDRTGQMRTMGRNARIDALQAAILRAKLPFLERWNEARRALAASYLRDLAGLPLLLPDEAPGTRHAWHLFVVRSLDREALKAGLLARGVETMVHYDWGWTPPTAPAGNCRLAGAVLSLPMSPWLTEEGAKAVSAAVRDGCTRPDAEPRLPTTA